MELLQLKYFQTVAYTEHISNAAKQLNIAQPSLSIMIKRLEDELGTVLFDRKGRHIQLNSSGEILLKHVNKIFTEIENAKMELQVEKKEKASTIKILISHPRFLSGLFNEYIDLYPDTKIQQGIGVKDEIQKSLKEGEIDLGIAGPPIEDGEIESCVLVDEDIVLAIPASHRLAVRSEISLSEIADESFISLANHKEYSSLTTELCEKAGFTPMNIFELDSDLLLEIFKFDKGVALLPVSVCRKCQFNYIKIADADATFTVGISWVKDKLLSPSIRNFRDFIISHFKNNEEFYKAH